MHIPTFLPSAPLLNKMPTISPCEKGLYVSLLFSSLLFLLKAFAFMTFIQNVNILNYLAITSRTKKCSDMLHVANGYCQPVINFQKSYIFNWQDELDVLTEVQSSTCNQLQIYSLFFIFSKIKRLLSSVRWPTITFSSDIHLAVVRVAWIKIHSCMLKPITLDGRLSLY